MSNSPITSTAATGSLLESGSTLEHGNGKDTSNHINDDKTCFLCKSRHWQSFRDSPSKPQTWDQSKV